MTPFQKEVYKALAKIPKGTVTTYGAIAKHLNTKAIRAVGTAVGKNPNAPQIPCHRVVPSNGHLGNYSAEGGVKTKVRLLAEEGVEVNDGKIVNYQQHLFVFESYVADA